MNQTLPCLLLGMSLCDCASGAVPSLSVQGALTLHQRDRDSPAAVSGGLLAPHGRDYTLWIWLSLHPERRARRIPLWLAPELGLMPADAPCAYAAVCTWQELAERDALGELGVSP